MTNDVYIGRIACLMRSRLFIIGFLEIPKDIEAKISLKVNIHKRTSLDNRITITCQDVTIISRPASRTSETNMDSSRKRIAILYVYCLGLRCATFTT